MSFVFRSNDSDLEICKPQFVLICLWFKLESRNRYNHFPNHHHVLFPLSFLYIIVAWVCPHDRELRLPCFQFPVCGNHVEWHSSPSLSPLHCGMGVPMIKNCDCPVINFPFVGTMLNGTVLFPPYPSVIAFLI